MNKLPKTKEEAFAQLDSLLSDEQRRQMAACSIDELYQCHFDLGMWIRNNWIYPHPEADILSIFANENGMRVFSTSPDIDSEQIVEAYWEHLQKQ